MLDCVTQCSQSAAHLCEQFLQVQQIGFVTLDPCTVRRGGCLELYYCNMVEWFWWDSNLILTTNWFPSVLWHCWFGHLACKIVAKMTYNVLSGMFSLYTTTTYMVMCLGSTSTIQMVLFDLDLWSWALNLMQHVWFVGHSVLLLLNFYCLIANIHYFTFSVLSLFVGHFWSLVVSWHHWLMLGNAH